MKFESKQKDRVAEIVRSLILFLADTLYPTPDSNFIERYLIPSDLRTMMIPLRYRHSNPGHSGDHPKERISRGVLYGTMHLGHPLCLIQRGFRIVVLL